MISPRAIVGTTLALALSYPAWADFTGNVVAVADGDTLIVLAEREQIKVRLVDIDAPESKQAFGQRSKQSLSDLCFNKTAKLEDNGKDRYGRTLARVYCDGVDANAKQVRRGMAWVYERYAPKDSPLYGVQAEARAAMRWQEVDGSVQLAYPRGAVGYPTFMVKIGPAGRLQSITNVLESESFARIHVGLTKDEVLRVLGPPGYGRTVYFKARDELVWDWRDCSDFGIARFPVLFDGTSETVRSAMSLVEYHDRSVAHCVR